MGGPIQQTIQKAPQVAPKAAPVADAILAVGALSVPVWVENLSTWFGVAAAFLGLLLLAGRVFILYRDLLCRKKPKKEDS